MYLNSLPSCVCAGELQLHVVLVREMHWQNPASDAAAGSVPPVLLPLYALWGALLSAWCGIVMLLALSRELLLLYPPWSGKHSVWNCLGRIVLDAAVSCAS
jgi:hypothetical protein